MGKLAGERKKKGVSEMGSFHTSIGGGEEGRKGCQKEKKKKIIPRCKSPAERVQQSQE